VVDEEQEDQLLHAVVHIGHVTFHLELVLVVRMAKFDELLGHTRPVQNPILEFLSDQSKRHSVLHASPEEKEKKKHKASVEIL